MARNISGHKDCDLTVASVEFMLWRMHCWTFSDLPANRVRRMVTVLLLTLLCFPLMGAELPDPFRTLTARSQLANLAALRPVLAEKPDDPQAWGVVTITYALLAMQGAREQWGGMGPWGDYAHLAATRVAAPAQATTLELAMPGLWVALLDHDDRLVVETLDRLGADRNRPEVRALRAMAMGNPAEVDKPVAPIECFARLVAGLAANDWKQSQARETDLDPWTVQALRFQTGGGGYREKAWNAAAKDAAWLMQGASIITEVADARLAELAAAAGGTLDAQQERMSRVSQCEHLLGRLPDKEAIQAATFVAVYRAVDAALDGPRGWKGSTPTGLFGLGDVARWQWDRLYMAAYHLAVNRRITAIPTLVEPIERALGQVLPVLRMRNVCDDFKPASRAAMVTALEDNAAGPERSRYGWGPCVTALTSLVTYRHPEAPSLLLQFLKQFPVSDLRCMERVMTIRGPLSTAVHPWLKQAAERSPWHFYFHRQALATAPQASMLANLGQGEPWTASVVDFPTVKPTTVPQHYFAMRLEGQIAFPTGGIWQVSIESDDGSRLLIGDQRVDNGGNHFMQMAHASLDLAGPVALPLRLDYYQRLGGMGLRLWWKGPQMDTATLVPASALSHGGTPGLDGHLWNRGDDDALDHVLGPASMQEWSARTPWNLRSLRFLVEEAVYAKDWSTVYRLCPRIPPSDDGWYKVSGWFLEAGLRIEPPLSAETLVTCMPIDTFGHFDKGCGERLLHLAAQPETGRRILDAMGNRQGQVVGFLQLFRLQAAMGVGDLRAALDAAERLDVDRWSTTAHTGYCAWIKEARILRVLLTRILSPERSLPKVGPHMNFCCASPTHQTIGAWLDSDLTWPETVHEAGEEARITDLPFLHACYLVSRGRLEVARAELAAFSETSKPDNTYHHFARSVLAWIDGLDEAGRTSLGQAPLLVGSDLRWNPKDPTPDPAKSGVSNF